MGSFLLFSNVSHDTAIGLEIFWSINEKGTGCIDGAPMNGTNSLQTGPTILDKTLGKNSSLSII